MSGDPHYSGPQIDEEAYAAARLRARQQASFQRMGERMLHMAVKYIRDQGGDVLSPEEAEAFRAWRRAEMEKALNQKMVIPQEAFDASVYATFHHPDIDPPETTK